MIDKRTDSSGDAEPVRRVGQVNWQVTGVVRHEPVPAVEGRSGSTAGAGIAEGADHTAEPRPVGAHRGVHRLARRTGLAVGRPDIDALVERGLLVAVDWFNGWPVYDCGSIDAISASVLGEIISERTTWLDAVSRHMDKLGTNKRPPLRGSHRAMPDCQTALDLLRHLTIADHHPTESP